MKKHLVLAFILGLSAVAHAQAIADPLDDGYQFPKRAVSRLPKAQTAIGRTVQVIDGQNNSDCTQGGGTYAALCASQVNPSTGIASWAPLTGGAATVNGQDITPNSVVTNTVTASSAVTAPNVAADLNVYTLAPNCAGAPNCVSTPVNTQYISDGAMNTSGPPYFIVSAGQANFQCPGAVYPCTSGGDVGKRIWAFISCSTDVSSGNATRVGGTTAATITEVLSPLEVYISQVPSGSVGSNACVIWGNPDDTAQATLETAMTNTNLGLCPAEQLPAGNLMWTSWHLQIDPVGCKHNGEYIGATAKGGGFTVRGQGYPSTSIFIDPIIPMTPCTAGTNSLSCMLIPQQGRWHDFTFNGGGTTRNGLTANKALIYAGGYSQIDHMGFINFGFADNNLAGMYQGAVIPVYCSNSVFDGWGSTAVSLDPGWMETANCIFEDSYGGTAAVQGINMNASGDILNSPGGNLIFTNTHAPATVQINNASSGSMVHLSPTDQLGSQNASTVGFTGYSASAGIAWLNGVYTRASNSGSTASIGIQLSSSAVAHVSNSYWANLTAGGTAYSLSGTSMLYDGGGNSVPTGSVASLSGTAQIISAMLSASPFNASTNAIPACSANYSGAQATVSDATTPTYLGIYTSGGAVPSAVICNGTNWVTH